MTVLLKQYREKTFNKDIPYQLAQSTLKISKKLALGAFLKSESQEKEAGWIGCSSEIKIEDILKSDELGRSRKEAGFILLDGLLGLGD